MHDPDPDPPSRPDTRRRWVALGVLSAAALLLHAAAFSGMGWVWPQAEAPVLPAAMQVRVLDAAPAARVAASPSAMPPAEATAPVVPARPAAPVRRKVAALAAKPVRATAVPVNMAAAEPAPTTEEFPAASLQLALNPIAPVAPPPAATVPDDETIPHYRTRMPPATTLRYEVQRGMLRGTGDLAWRPQGDHYELKLDFRLSGLVILSQSSTGGFDAAGIAPDRFTDQRLRRGTTAANFQRGADKITYSGSQNEFALRAGAQDRLSWMVQLAAIVAAEPRLASPGAKVVMYVTGAHGDVGVWSFRCVGAEAVDARGGTINAIKFVREPREARDTTVQVWLDPQRNDLPVRATQKSGPDDAGYELRLLEVIAPN